MDRVHSVRSDTVGAELFALFCIRPISDYHMGWFGVVGRIVGHIGGEALFRCPMIVSYFLYLHYISL